MLGIQSICKSPIDVTCSTCCNFLQKKKERLLTQNQENRESVTSGSFTQIKSNNCLPLQLKTYSYSTLMKHGIRRKQSKTGKYYGACCGPYLIEVKVQLESFYVLVFFIYMMPKKLILPMTKVDRQFLIGMDSM